MEIRPATGADGPSIVDLFAATFADCAGAAEGAMIGTLVARLLAGAPAAEGEAVVTVADDGSLKAAIVFSPLR
ncbi:MAG: hypothetical protein ACYTF0_09050, partial [Planctomycetota bacterium]